MSRDALIVGINHYKSLRKLQAPARDAEAIAQRLAKDGEFRIIRLPEKLEEGEEIKPVISETASVSQMQLEQALERLFRPNSKQAPETALFYFSGHGIPDEKGYDKGYLAASDTNPENPRTGLSLRWLHWLLSESPIKRQIVWLDCCHSGSLIVNVGAANPGNGESRDRCFIASSRDFEESWEDLNSPYSVLTKALLEGLEPTRLPGRWIDTFALADYVNQALKGELQTPVCTNFGEAIPLTMALRVREAIAVTGPKDAGKCPYKGLEFFDCNEEDPQYFFGRDRLTGELLDRVRTNNFLALVGASGNGKSSVLRAGLLHQLKLGRRLAGSEKWKILMMRPDRQPMQNLALAFVYEDLSDLERAKQLDEALGLLEKGAAGLRLLVEASTAPRVVLAIDQFEEVFIRCEDIGEREAFLACLMGALSEENGKFCLILAMRSDFVGKCLEREYSGLARRVQGQMVGVLPMQPEELKAAICEPAKAVGLELESALVREILEDIAGAPGSLPLLQYALKELWQQRQENRLVLSAYHASGGIRGTLDKRATDLYNSFAPEEQETVRHIFQQLTQLGEGAEDTRRRVFLGNLVAEPHHSAARVEKVIDRLASPENRLLVTGEVRSKGDESARLAVVDVAHEALIRHWRLLQRWIEGNRDLLRQQRKIEAGAVVWREGGERSGYLLQGLPLTEAIAFGKEHGDRFPLSESTKVFVKRSIQHRFWSRVKTASWLIIPALFLVGVVEFNLRENSVKADYRALDQEDTYEEKQAVENLVRGCGMGRLILLPVYITERLFGNCRSLVQAPLTKAKLNLAYLRSADLRNVDLRDAELVNALLSGADLRNADLRDTDLSFAVLNFTLLNEANLRNTDLSNAILGNADLRNADLRDTDLSNTDFTDALLDGANLNRAKLNSANLYRTYLINTYFNNANFRDTDLSLAPLNNTIFLNTDLRNTTGLTQKQLQGDLHPFVCNSPLPKGFKIDLDRDCDRLPPVLRERYPDKFKTIEEAKEYVKEARQEKWE
ncbi:MAG: pentapeptide repeat-containing protein [Cyanobacteria bacterium SBLK]|nr:pentapeptide repeat-containing protein [Cyanobacteria bacterium SBLK]